MFTQNQTGKRIETLDGLRGIAILIVMMAHCYLCLRFLASPAAAPRHWPSELLLRLMEFGWMGVDLFFVLSGFLITGILLRNRGDAHYFRNFYGRRAVRILPLYYVVLVLYFFLLPVRNIPGDTWDFNQQHQIWYWLGLQNIVNAAKGSTGGLLGIYWSLAIEEQFYLVWPAIVLFCSRRAIRWIGAGMLVLSFALRLIFSNHNAAAMYNLTVSRLDPLALGCLVALLMEDERTRSVLSRIAKYSLPVAIALFVGLMARLGEFDQLNRPVVKTSMYQPGMQKFGFLLLAFAFASAVVLAVTPGVPRFQWFLRLPLLRLFGKHSYAIYVFHLLVFGGLNGAGLNVDFFYSRLHIRLAAYLALIAVYCGAALLVGFLIWHLFEKYPLRLKERMRSSPRTLAVRVPAGALVLDEPQGSAT